MAQLRIMFICLVFLFLQSEASKLSFEAFPNDILQNVTSSASMMCRVVDTKARSASSPTDVRHISSIYILRGDGDDVASVTAYDPATALVDIGNLDVKGSVSAVSGEGSLELSWKDPSKMTFGEYTCSVSGIDDRGHPVTLSSQLTVNSVTPSVMDLINNINVKMEKQQQVIQKQEQDIEHQQQHATDHDQVIQKLQQNITNQYQTIQKLQQNITNQDQTIQKLQHNLTNQDQTIHQLEAKLQNCSARVAFQSALSKTTAITHGNTVVYDDTRTNDGNSYDNNTGIFTCDIGGLYMFNAHALSDVSSSGQVVLKLKVNSEVIASLHSGNSKMYDSASVSVVVPLKAGDVVRMVAVVNSTLYLNSDIVRANVFNGVLTQADACAP